MCGIAGCMRLGQGAAIELDAVTRVRDHLRSRGPDGAGLWLSEDGRAALAHRRLAIIDLSERGLQPMHEGALSITFNGEIYNYQALRAELVRRGERFQSDSDTEVLLKWYRIEGVAMFSRLRGMYALAIWDAERGELLLARDPFGIKPLYYAQHAGQLWFASQARALVDTGAVPATLDARAWAGFLLWGSVPEPRSVYAKVRALPAGSWLRVREAGLIGQPQPHSDLNRLSSAGRTTASAEVVRAAVLDSVRHHLVADVPVGVFLSAGIDSAAVLGLAAELAAPPESVTLGFAEFAGSARDEAPLAADIANRYGSRHHVRRVDRAEFEADLPAILAAMDQPSIDGVNTWFVSKAARELGWKVALSGLGGDELFGGYPAFADLPRWVGRLGWTRHLPRTSARIGRWLGRLARHPKAQGMLAYGGNWAGAYFLRRGLFMPWELEAERPSWLPDDPDALAEMLDALQTLISPDPGSDHARVSLLESAWYMRHQLLRDSDWASMAHSIELRVPLVDVELTRALAPALPARSAGSSVAKSLLGAAPRPPLPASFIERPKSGFETPVGGWIEGRDPREPWARAWARRVLQYPGFRGAA